MLAEIQKARQLMEDAAAKMSRCANELARAEGAIRVEVECRRVAENGGVAMSKMQRDFALAAADKEASQGAAFFGLAMASFKECGADDLARKSRELMDAADRVVAEIKEGGPKPQRGPRVVPFPERIK